MSILDLYGEADQPNFYHFFLAEMLKRKSTVFTTNFDSLIEYAMKKISIDFSKIPIVIKDNDWKEKKYTALYKLHGSIWDISMKDKIDTRYSLKATIDQIEKGNYSNNHLLSKNKLKMFNYII